MPSWGHKSPNKAPLFVIYSKYRSPRLLTRELIFALIKKTRRAAFFSRDILEDDSSWHIRVAERDQTPWLIRWLFRYDWCDPMFNILCLRPILWSVVETLSGKNILQWIIMNWNPKKNNNNIRIFFSSNLTRYSPLDSVKSRVKSPSDQTQTRSSGFWIRGKNENSNTST